MKLLFYFASCLFLSVTALGQIPDVLRPDCEQKSLQHPTEFCSHPVAVVQAGNRALVKRPYNVLQYRLWMDWTNPLNSLVAGGNDHTYSGINTITIQSDSTGLQIVVLDAASITIDSAFLLPLGKRLPAQPLNSIKGYAIDLLSPKFQGDTFTIAVYYTHIGNENRGLYLYPKGYYVGKNATGDSVKTLAPIAYTMSEPEDARYWMPCNDNPYDKARFDIGVVLPFNPNAEENFIASTSIDGKERRLTTNNQVTFGWTNDTTPISTYLVSLNASYFVHYQQWYKRFSNPADSIPIDNYVWQKDFEDTVTDGTHYNAKNALRRMPEMMGFLSERFIEYPFKSYGHTAIHPFAFGGMEHQTMTSINRSWLYGRDESGFEHELGHQWFGDLVTCATWADIWLNEGGATFTEALWAEHNGGQKGYRNFLHNAKIKYLDSEQPAVYGIAIGNLFNYGTTYAKGAWVYAMLRYVVGDSVFFPVMRQYFRDYAYSTAETEDLLAYFESHVQNPSVPFRTFFEQWLYKRGHPEYNVAFSTEKLTSDEYKTTVTLSQSQTGENVPDVFVMPVQITLKGSKGERFVSFIKSALRVNKAEYVTTFPVIAVTIDEEEKILCLTSDAAVSVEEQSPQSNEFAIIPNPVAANGSFSINFGASSLDSKVYIAIYDITGQEISVLHDGVIPPGKYTISRQNNLPSGVYYIRANIDGKVFASSLTVIR